VESLPAESAPVKPSKSAVKLTKSAAVEPAHAAAVKPTKSAAVEPAHAAVVKSATPADARRLGEIWLAARGSAYQTSRDCKSPPYAGPGSMFA